LRLPFFMIIKAYLSLIRFSHTLFALPFALVGFFLGAADYPDQPLWQLAIWGLLAMVFARSAAMAFNRYIDRSIDAKNPRTQAREIPSGLLSPSSVVFFVALMMLGFVLVTLQINRTCLFLSPLALLVVLGYSYTKRFTWLCHFVLGIGLALAPVGAYVAVSASFSLVPILMGCSVLFWVAGFDILYALQDVEFDQSEKLHSVPVRFGLRSALRIARFSHLFSAIFITCSVGFMVQRYEQTGFLSWMAAGLFILQLIRQHLEVNEDDFSRANQIFFTVNGIASLLFGGLIMVDFLI